MSASAVDPLASALAAMVDDGLDVTDVLARLVAEVAVVVGAGSVALMARDGDHDLALLAATSHHAVEIEMLQAQRSAGPCADSVREGVPVRVVGADDLVARWPDVGRALVDAGCAGVESYPMRWRGESIGALNLFFTTDDAPSACAIGQAFADVATLVLVQAVGLSLEQVRASLQEALTARELVEQAKGVLAYVDGLELGEAYDELLRRADGSTSSLTQVARDVVDRRGAPHD